MTPGPSFRSGASEGSPRIILADGNAMPQVGLGVFNISDSAIERSLSAAFEAGYRGIDTAANYGNEQAVGRAIRESGIPRSEIFLTTKLWNADQGYQRCLDACEASLHRLEVEYVDLYLIHWPCPADGLYEETWEAFQRIKADGRARSIGVSNFLPEHLERLSASGGERPTVNQCELHPRMQQADLRAFNSAHDIATQAFSPLGVGRLLEEPTLQGIASSVGRSVAQTILRWHIQLGHAVIPKSSDPRRVAANIRVFDFDLSPAQMESIAALDGGQRFFPHPNDVTMSTA